MSVPRRMVTLSTFFPIIRAWLSISNAMSMSFARARTHLSMRMAILKISSPSRGRPDPTSAITTRLRGAGWLSRRERFAIHPGFCLRLVGSGRNVDRRGEGRRRRGCSLCRGNIVVFHFSGSHRSLHWFGVGAALRSGASRGYGDFVFANGRSSGSRYANFPPARLLL